MASHDRALITKMRDTGGGAYCKSCNVLFKEPGVWVYRGMVVFGGSGDWCRPVEEVEEGGTRPLWPLGKATSGRTGGVRCAPRGCVHRTSTPAMPCLHNSAQMWASSVKFNRFPGLARRRPPPRHKSCSAMRKVLALPKRLNKYSQTSH